MTTTSPSLFPKDPLDWVFPFLELSDLCRLARVCTRWKDLTKSFKKSKENPLFEDLLKGKIEGRGMGPSLRECYFITSMLQETHATPRLVSKFIRGDADNFCMLKVISIAKNLTEEQVTDAVDLNCSKEVIEAILTKTEGVPAPAIVTAIKHGNVKILSLFLEKSFISPHWVLNKAFDLEVYACVEWLCSAYPDLVMSLEQVIKTTELRFLTAEYFEIVLNQYLKQKGSKISFATVERIAGIIDSLLWDARHTSETEKIFELIAKAYVTSNKLSKGEFGKGNFEAKEFIWNDKHPIMTAKLIQAVDEMGTE